MGIFKLTQLSTDDDSLAVTIKPEPAKETPDPSAPKVESPVNLLANETTQPVLFNADYPNKDNTKKEKVVVLDGPLSHIYTQALNMAYAHENENDEISTEGISMMFDALIIRKNEEEPVDDPGYLYCASDDTLTDGGLVAASDSIRVAIESKKYKHITVAIECGDLISNRVQLLDEMCHVLGVKVCLTRKSAVQTVLKNL